VGSGKHLTLQTFSHLTLHTLGIRTPPAQHGRAPPPYPPGIRPTNMGHSTARVYYMACDHIDLRGGENIYSLPLSVQSRGAAGVLAWIPCRSSRTTTRAGPLGGHKFATFSSPPHCPQHARGESAPRGVRPGAYLNSGYQSAPHRATCSTRRATTVTRGEEKKYVFWKDVPSAARPPRRLSPVQRNF
jgi:hypothetical protein